MCSVTNLDTRLFRRWGHSFEEDAEGARVYRPDGHAFPRARGRGGIELRPDGTYLDWAVGRGDAAQARAGAWHFDEEGRLHLTAEGDERVVRIVQVTDDRLELRSET